MHQPTALAVCVLLLVCRVYGQDNGGPGRARSAPRHLQDRRHEKTRTVSPRPAAFEAGDDVDLDWLADAVRDVGYYLRAHKFNEYDRRYDSRPPSQPGKYVGGFPRPILRSLHWEVHKYCDQNFITCLKYLDRKIQETALRRRDDTSVVILEQRWDMVKDKKQINAVQKDCEKMKKRDDRKAEPFLGPLERYQWRTTASYYMCWYTMNEVEVLRHFNESCDNFANCFDKKFGPSNADPRARDNESFACALYSFCPDPCCSLRHISSMEDCTNSSANPCPLGPPEHRVCFLNRSANVQFRQIVLNRWNVTCPCTEHGYTWSSRYGACVDVNECSAGGHGCRKEEVCVNLPGSFACTCGWGYVWRGGTCVESAALAAIKRQRANVTQKSKPKSLIKSLIRTVFYKSSGLKRSVGWLVVSVCVLFCVRAE